MPVEIPLIGESSVTMTIARLLLVAFLLLTLLVSTLFAGLTFYAAREALAVEIDRNLGKDAGMLMGQVDMLLFERLQNIHSWSHLEIMQESRIGDVDKRLARFLAEIRLGYGEVYRELFFVNRDNRIVASSLPAHIGLEYTPKAAWAEALVPGGEVFLEPLLIQPPYATADLPIRAPVANVYESGDLGHLYGAFDLTGLFRLFDETEFSAAGQRFVALLDRDGRLIAASQSLRKQGLMLGNAFAHWRSGAETSALRSGAPAVEGQVLAGYAVSRGYQGYPGLGWSVLVFQPAEQAFRPIRTLLWLFCVAFVFTGLVAVAAATAIAGRIARPLVGLTDWARGFMQRETYQAPETTGSKEIRELGAAFGQMVKDLEKTRQQVIHAAKLAVVGEMAAIMAHEVRTPLGILHTSAQILARERTLGTQGTELARIILDESSRLGRLITTLLECARPRPPKMLPKDAHAVLQRVTELLAAQIRKKNLHTEWSLDNTAAIIQCDEELLMQVFLNLVMNAVQITPDGGRVGIVSRRQGDTLLMEIKDDGPGIAAQYMARVFDPFFTTREGGIGLGLTVTRQIVAAHGGEITVERSDWGGASFQVRLPVSGMTPAPGKDGPLVPTGKQSQSLDDKRQGTP